MPKIAYSYNRYSSPQQGDGDSIRRQTALARKWCERHGYTLDTNTTYEDRGKSGYHGKHRESGMLRRLLDDVEDKHIPRGSVLLIENMDRLSREKPVVGVNVLTGLLMAGIRVVQLSPDEVEFTEDSDLFTLFRGQLSQARGRDESANKARRMAEVWGERQRLARDEGQRVTTRLPAWLEVRGGTLTKVRGGRAKLAGGTIHAIPARAKVIRDIFRLAIEGHGLAMIVRHLTEKKIESWGRGGTWSKAYVYKILTGKSALGQYQPHKNDEPDGAPIPGYYPAVVDADTWARAQHALAARKDKPGRITAKATAALFSGLLYEAGTGDKLLVANQTRGSGTKNRQKRRVLVSAGSMEGRARSVSFPLDVFEPAVLKRLKEIDPADVFEEAKEGESTALAAELARVRQSMDAINTDLEQNGDSPAVLARLRAKEGDHARLTRRLAEAKREEKHPRSASLAEARTLIDAANEEGTRLRLRQLLRDAIEAVWVLIEPRKSGRFALVQILFGATSRWYAIAYRPGRRGRKGDWLVKSFAETGLPEIDMRKEEHVARLKKVLAAIDLDKINAGANTSSETKQTAGKKRTRK